MALYRNQHGNNKAISGEVSLLPMGHGTPCPEIMADIQGTKPREERIVRNLIETSGNRSTAIRKPPVSGGD